MITPAPIKARYLNDDTSVGDDLNDIEYEPTDIGFLAGTIVSSAYDLVEEFEQLGVTCPSSLLI